ncbi:MAG: DUF5665 domain-containing protein [bacterium]|nr:DUF5665 domain-containing protein [bacterium]
MKSQSKTQKIADENARSAQINLLEELFYDIYPNRWVIYKVNFLRGISFGFGSAIGATVLFFLLIWFLNLFVNIPGGIGDFIQAIINAMNSR